MVGVAGERDDDDDDGDDDDDDDDDGDDDGDDDDDGVVVLGISFVEAIGIGVVGVVDVIATVRCG
jgi:hypothetical protein